jgi:hypothetical protein
VEEDHSHVTTLEKELEGMQEKDLEEHRVVE